MSEGFAGAAHKSNLSREVCRLTCWVHQQGGKMAATQVKRATDVLSHDVCKSMGALGFLSAKSSMMTIFLSDEHQ